MDSFFCFLLCGESVWCARADARSRFERLELGCGVERDLADPRGDRGRAGCLWPEPCPGVSGARPFGRLSARPITGARVCGVGVLRLGAR